MPENSHEKRTVFYHQGCPVCGRRLQIDVALLGRRVYCQHCGGGFVAADDALRCENVESGPRPAASKVDLLLHRVAAALERAAADGHGFDD